MLLFVPKPEIPNPHSFLFISLVLPVVFRVRVRRKLASEACLEVDLSEKAVARIVGFHTVITQGFGSTLWCLRGFRIRLRFAAYGRVNIKLRTLEV